MKNRIKEVYRTGGLWAVLLATLGFAFSCNGGSTMYGSPYADFEMKIKVVDSADAPLPNIRIDLSQADDYKYTDSMGVAQFKFRGYSSIHGIFDDIDGPENGGKFKTTDTTFYFSNSQFDKSDKKDDNWYKGKLKTEVKIVMQKEDEQ